VNGQRDMLLKNLERLSHSVTGDTSANRVKPPNQLIHFLALSRERLSYVRLNVASHGLGKILLQKARDRAASRNV
jgi:hypothetical protein